MIDQVEPHGFTKLGSLFAIPDWLFEAKPYLVSRDNPASLRYVCQRCGLIEPRSVSNGYIRRECACERALREEIGHEQFKAVTQATVAVQKTARTYTWLGAPGEDSLASMSFENYNPAAQPDREAFEKHKDEAKSYAECIIKARAYKETFSRNLAFLGTFGTGKTHLAAAILNTLRSQCIPCLFCTVQGFFDALYARDFEAKPQLIEQASATPLLVLDELDKLYVRQETDGAYQKRTLFGILDSRYKRKLPTVLTANEQHDLSTWLDGATISRLLEHITIVPMNGMDYRSIRGRI